MASYYYIDPASQPLNYPSQGAAPVIEYVPPTLPDLELNQLLNGQPTGISPFGPRSGAPSYEMMTPEDVDGVPSAEDLAFAIGGPGGAYAAYRAGQAMRGMYDDLMSARAGASVTPSSQPALPAGSSRAALPAGNDPLALPPKPTFSTPKERILYELQKSALKERYSPDRANYYRPSPGAIRDMYVPFEAARDKLIARGNYVNRSPHSAPAGFQPIPQNMADRLRVLDDLWAKGTITPEQNAERSAIWDTYRNREIDYRKSIQLTPEEEAAWLKNASPEMNKDVMRGKSTKGGLGPQGKAALARLGSLASRAGSTVMGLAGFTGIITQLINPDPFDPLGNAIIRANPEAYPEQVKRYNDYISQPI